MKKLTALIGALTFSTLFYDQTLGLNLFLFSITTLVLCFSTQFELRNNKSSYIIALAYLGTSVAYFFNQSSLTLTASIFTFIAFVGNKETQVGIYTKWLNGLYTTLVAAFATYFDEQQNPLNKKKAKINYSHWFKIIGIPTIITIVFIQLYKLANPVFSELIAAIDFSFINTKWILITSLGYYLFNNILNPITIEPLTVTDKSTSNFLNENEIKKVTIPKLLQEKQLATILIGTLNILIILFLITDVAHLKKLQLMLASELSDQVHNGINALIASIVLAIFIIVYFFRGQLNFLKENHVLKNLTYSWIFLNMILVGITAVKNYQYIASFGFTYKRIGVLVYLLLTLIGLITTYTKVHSKKNVLFLIRTNSSIAFAILIISSCLNWDILITNYNLNYASKIDYKYLIDLSYQNTFVLEAHKNTNNVPSNAKFSIESKVQNYHRVLNKKDWQELTYHNLRSKK